MCLTKTELQIQRWFEAEHTTQRRPAHAWLGHTLPISLGNRARNPQTANLACQPCPYPCKWDTRRAQSSVTHGTGTGVTTGCIPTAPGELHAQWSNRAGPKVTLSIGSRDNFWVPFALSKRRPILLMSKNTIKWHSASAACHIFWKPFLVYRRGEK